MADGPSTKWTPLSLVAFRPTQVSFWIALTYVVLLASIFTVHTIPPTSLQEEAPAAGINQTQAWRDLQELSKTFRPWNSARNGQVNYWLSKKIEHIVAHNNQDLQIIDNGKHVAGTNRSKIVLWNDDGINVTIIDPRRQPPMPAYIESQNILLYVRGIEDEQGAWWERSYQHRQGILVNAHYDSVSTGYGATDDGCGVISILQLISHFTTEGYQPRRGIIFLLNDGEEDGLYGAHTFSQHPWSSFPGAFLNLEGAGAGGRAALFRSTDAEITSFYTTPHPFGTVLTGDGFKRGLVRSDTDYTVFTQDLDIRGLDVAFMEPRSRYHTDQDAARDSSRDSLYHMLSMALSTTQRLSDYQGEWQPLSAHSSDSGVWFDIYGTIWIVSTIKTFAAIDITLMVVGPLILAAIVALQVRQGRWYPFLTRTVAGNEEQVVHGLRGLFRTPLVLLLAIFAALALSDLIDAQNPVIVYRSPYVVLAMFLSGFLLTVWILSKLADHIRPAVFTRWFTLLWLYLLTWVTLVIVTHQAIADQLGSGYIMLVLHLTTFLALLIGTLELFSLPRHISLASTVEDQNQADERTSLLNTSNQRTQQTFTGIARRPESSSGDTVAVVTEATLEIKLPTWTWLLQFLLLAVNVVLLGHLTLLTISALHQTPADGNPISTIYLVILALSVVVALPILPFVHKLRPTVAFLLVLVLLASSIWSTTAFPFSREARLKYFFLQRVDLKTGYSNTTLTAIEPFLHDIIGELPSATGQELECSTAENGLRRGLPTCSWHGLSADVVDGKSATWVEYDVTRIDATSVLFSFQGKQTKNCRLLFDTPVSSLSIQGAELDVRNPDVSTSGATQLRLFSRDWEKRFHVNVTWSQNSTQTGKVGCMWAELDKVPAIKELQTFAPVWTALTKNDDGLVEGWYDWEA